MAVNEFRYKFEPQGSARWESGSEILSDEDLPDNGGKWTDLISAVHRPVEDWAHDLQRTARAVYLADRKSPRRGGATDGWTRSIRLDVTVRDAAAWNSTAPTLQLMLETLTADRWQVSFSPRSEPYSARHTLAAEAPVTDVTTLSGGLDSITHALELASKHTDGAVLLIAFYHGLLREKQLRIYERINDQANRPMVLRQIHQVPRHSAKQPDPTQRTRGLLYAAAAIFAAAGHRLDRASLPENGVMAINGPLTASRPAACSTRSVHPTVLMLLNDVIAQVGGTVRLRNPYQALTKGEVCRRALAFSDRPDWLWDTVSCGHPHRQALVNCGHCYPCLVRRAGLHAAVGRDETAYARCLESIEVNSNQQSARDLRAVLIWLINEHGVDDVLADTQLPPDLSAGAVLQLQNRARDEMANMIKAVRPDLSGMIYTN